MHFCLLNMFERIVRSRRLRCRLRTLLILFLPSLAALSALLNSERKVIGAMDELGKKGVVVLEPSGPEWVQSLAHKRYPMWVRRIGWRYGYAVKDISVHNADDHDIRHISWLSGVETVSLWGPKYGLDGLQELRRLPHLRQLSLGGRSFSGEEIERLRRSLPNCTIDR
jgi:hypothetical protein